MPAPVVTELEWLVTSRLGDQPFLLFLDTVIEGSVAVEELLPEDYRRIRELLVRCADLPLRFVDAAVVAVAERLGEKKLATLDRRHFGVVRPRHVKAFKLLPAES